MTVRSLRSLKSLRTMGDLRLLEFFLEWVKMVFLGCERDKSRPYNKGYI